MKIYDKIKPFISLVCVIAIIFSVYSFPVVAVDNNTVTATTNASVKQGSTGICYIYIDSTKDLAALDISVHFDSTKVKILNVYNSVSCTLYDTSKTSSSINFSYIFDGKGTDSKTRLFYFSYQVLSNAEVGTAYFDVTIGDAYDNSLNDVAISGSRCSFQITETVANKTCSIYCNDTYTSSNAISTLVEEEFSLSYKFSTYQIASGSAVIEYDQELFEVVSVTTGGFLENKLSDINTSLKGAIYLSFVGTTYNYKMDVVTVKFRTIKNVDETSNIVFKATELYDIDLNPYSCSSYNTQATVVYDNTYLGDAPRMRVSTDYNSTTQQLVATISLDEKSKLGAGDFILNFDSDMLTLSSYEKGFTPTFFNINDKEVENGVLKFSIISLSNITTAETVLTLVFDVADSFFPQETMLTLNGSMISDSLTNSIPLGFVDGFVTIPATCILGDVDHDGDVDKDDYNIVVNIATLQYIPTENQVLVADANQDGAVDCFDAIYIDLFINE